MLVPIICEMADTHWHKVLQESLIALKTILREIDPVMFEKVNQIKSTDQKKKDNDTRNKQENRWDKIYNMALKKDSNIIVFDKNRTFDLLQ